MDNYIKLQFRKDDYEFVERWLKKNNLKYYIEGTDTVLIPKEYETILREITVGRVNSPR